MLKPLSFSCLLSIWLALPAHADLTIVQKVEGMGGSPTDMTIKVKGDKTRIDATPQLSTIIDAKTGEMTNLMKDQKAVIRISAEKMKAAAAMLNKFDDKHKATEKPKLTATGKKETVNGFETDQYVCDTPDFKATYWIAPKYPDGVAILKQLQSLNSQALSASNSGMPDYRDFPGLPIKMVISMGGTQITNTLTSITQDPLSDADFSVPADFQEIKTPELGKALPGSEKKPAVQPSPKP